MAVKKEISQMAGYKCSNPDCRKNLLSDGNVIGQIAHIIAATPNGPRASSNFNQDRAIIKSACNGLLLCHHCGTLVDKDPGLYTIDLLKKWKETTEVWGRFNVQKTVIHAELEKLEKIAMSYQFEVDSVIKQRDVLRPVVEENTLLVAKNTQLENELQMCRDELERTKQELAEAQAEGAIKDKYIMNLIQSKILPKK